LTLERLASAVGCSTRRLATSFRRETGRTVHRQLAHVRVRHALELILRGDEKVEAVSAMVGYKSKKNFYHQFKRIVGVTPTAYKAGMLKLGTRGKL
jgi:AraC-like DNA-binding protein